MRHICPVCGYPDLLEPPRTAGGGSYEICWSCGFQFGVTDDDLGIDAATHRLRWIARGMPWDAAPRHPPPHGWDPVRQLRRVEFGDDRRVPPSGYRPGMPSEKKPGPSVKDDETYEALRDEGASKEKAARIANAAANTSRSEVGRKGGQAGSYDDWTVDDLRERAAELDVEGRSSMTKDELIDALRSH